MKKLDARGWECPKPIIESKKLLEPPDCAKLLVLVDNDIALDNLYQFARGRQWSCSHVEDGDGYAVTIAKDTEQESAAGRDCSPLFILITANRFGQGSEELGEKLMSSYLYALSEEDELPEHIAFLNSGVYLTTAGSPVLDILDILETKGVGIVSCGACLNYYGLEQQLKVGGVSNMYEIAGMMYAAKRVIHI